MKIKVLKNLIIYIIILTLTGCSGAIKSEENEKNTVKLSKTSKKSGYIESVVNIPENITYIRDIKKVDSGEIILVTDDENFNETIYKSLDEGNSWDKLDIGAVNYENKDISKLYTNILSNGKIIESYGEDLIENQFAARYFITNNQMEFQSINLTLNQESTHLDDMPIQFIELNNKDLISRISGNKLVQLDSDNFTEKYRYEFDSYIDGYSNVDDMLIINIENQMLVYDINTGEKVTELNEFMNTIKNLSGEVKVVSSPTKDYLYYCNNSKLFGYNLKDNTSTEIISNAKYIDNSSLYIEKFIKINEKDFMIIMNNSDDHTGTLIKYKYSDDIQEIENDKIIIYSLVEDELLQNAITKLNMNNPNITINYQIGVPEETGVDTSDAIKKLNTEIMAGKGPDILLLDNLPVDSYIENGVLADIKDIVTTDKNIFPRLIKAYEKDGAIYQFPLKISLPVLVGNKDLIKEANDLNSLLTVIKEYSSQTDSRIFEYLGTPEEFIYNFYFIFENGWINKNNKINKNDLTNFLEICSEIYKISKEKDDIYKEQMYDDYVNQMKSLGLSESEIENGYSEILRDGNGYMNSINLKGMFYYKNKPLLALGSIDTPYQFEDLYNLMLRDSSITYEILKNNEESIFYPTSKIGINNNSKNIKLAKEILSNILTSNVYSENLTPNKEQITNSLLMDDISNEYEYNSENNHYLKFVEKDINSDGSLIETPIYWLNENDINDINSRIDKIDTERETNMILISEVAKQFTEIIDKNLKPKDATEKIIDNIEIYLSE